MARMFESTHFIGNTQVIAKLYYRNKVSMFGKKPGWYYHYQATLGDTGYEMSGQVLGPFPTLTAAYLEATRGYHNVQEVTTLTCRHCGEDLPAGITPAGEPDCPACGRNN